MFVKSDGSGVGFTAWAEISVKILYLLPRIPWPLHDGGAVATYQQMRYLRRAGHHITVLALNPVKFRQDPSVLAEVCDRVETVDVDTTPSRPAAILHLFSRPPYKYRRFYSKEMAARLRTILTQEEFDVIVPDQTPMVLYVPDIRAVSAVPIVHRNHNVEYALLTRMARGSESRLLSWYLSLSIDGTRAMERDMYGLCDGIAPMTEQDAERIRALGCSTLLRPVALGVDVDAFDKTPEVRALPRSLLYFGSFDWGPNADAVHWLMRDIWPALKAKFPDLELHIGGKNPGPDIFAFNKQPGVHVHANVPSAPKFLNSYDILLVPLRIGGGMRVKVVEAMAAHKAIVSTGVGAEGIDYRDGRDLLIAENPEEFVKSVARLLEDAAFKQSLEQAARNTAVQKYSWETLTQEFERFLQEAAGQAENSER